MKVLIAIDSFKGSISSIQGSEAISKGIKEVYPNADIITLPLADGGEGTVEALVYATGGSFVGKEIVGPLGNKIKAVYGTSNDGLTGIIEVAAACGLPLMSKNELNPMKTTTFGVGELIVDAMEKGCRNFIIGLGGSATNDAGVGMLQAIGYRFLDNNNEEVPYGGQGLSKIVQIETNNVHPLVKKCTFQIACDVKNHLYGNDGAAYVFAPQKGASPEMVIELDDGLRNFATIVNRELGVDVHNIEGAGAAGGLGAAFFGFLDGKMKSGIGLILDEIELNSKLAGVDVVITGEGMLDSQTALGKAPYGVAQLASTRNIPVIALTGSMEYEHSSLNDNGMTACFSIVNKPMTLQEAMDTENTYANLRFTTNQIFRLLKGVSLIKQQ